MARQSLPHAGFLIPNAGRSGDPRLSEPDAVDFNTLANGHYGVIQGCRVQFTNTQASLVEGGLVLIDGEIVAVQDNQTLNIATGVQARYVLLTIDQGGSFRSIEGTPNDADPVFPEVPADQVLISSVYVPVGTTALGDTALDKRYLLQQTLHSEQVDGYVKVANQPRGKTSPQLNYVETANGHHYWGDGDDPVDTEMFRSGPRTLRIVDTVDTDTVQAVDVQANTVKATSTISGSNLMQGSTRPATANPGDLFQQDNGSLWLWVGSTGWSRLSTDYPSAGMVIQSFEEPQVMIGQGWFHLNGQTITEVDSPDLFRVSGLQKFITPGPFPRSMKLPDANDRVLKSVASGAGQTGGTSSTTLTEKHIPYHGHTATVSRDSHSHAVQVNDKGHNHFKSMAKGNEGAVMVPVYNQASSSDIGPDGTVYIAPNIYHHRRKYGIIWPIERIMAMRRAPYGVPTSKTGITASTNPDEHGHNVTIKPSGNTGQVSPISVEQPFLTVYSYIKG